MGTKQMRVSDDLYARVKAANRDGETLAETLDRLVGGYSLTDFADDATALRTGVAAATRLVEQAGTAPPAFDDLETLRERVVVRDLDG